MFQASILKGLLAPVAGIGAERLHRYSSYPGRKNALRISRQGFMLQNPRVWLNVSPSPLPNDTPVEEVYVDAGAMKTALATVRNDSYVSIEYNKINDKHAYLLILINAVRTQTSKHIRCCDKPDIHDLIIEDMYTTTSESILGFFNRMKPFLATDPYRTNLGGINFHKSTAEISPVANLGGIRAVATDGYCLALEDYPEIAGFFDHEALQDFTVTSPPWKLMSFLKRYSGPLALVSKAFCRNPEDGTISAQYMMIQSGSWKIALPFITDAPYPSIYQLFNEYEGTSISLKKDVVSVFSSTSKSVAIEASDGTLSMITHKSKFPEAEKTITAVTLSAAYPKDQAFKVGFETKLLEKVFNYLEVPVITLQANKEHLRQHIVCVPKRVCLVMPIRVDVFP
ncbi:MAG: hypothetical protein WC455_09140 [Dehalococcoidia bacterium]